jgi:hypothetical protein
MNPSDALSSTQMTLSWTLLGVLLAWMFFCAFLALRPRRAERPEAAELPTPSGAFPAVVPHTPLRLAPAAVELSFSSVPAVPADPPSEIGSTPVA